ncbi:MAG TPA: LytR C-terminal domain-containing protein [archaeon]|nr:LytR C-terminal domain-containing protein [archaeon]
MSDSSLKKNRQKHLKNLRKAQKTRQQTQKTSSRKQAVSTHSNPLVTLGLVLSSVIFVILLSSMFFQYKGSIWTPSQKAAGQEAVPVFVDPSTVEVRILNGCGVPGAGRTMSSHLRDLHFDVVSAENAENFSYEQTLVIDHSGRPEVGQAVAEALGCSRLSANVDDMALVDVTVILGQDWETFIKEPRKAGKSNRIQKVLSKAKSLLGIE